MNIHVAVLWSIQGKLHGVRQQLTNTYQLDADKMTAVYQQRWWTLLNDDEALFRSVVMIPTEIRFVNRR